MDSRYRARWLADLSDHFGEDEVASWDRFDWKEHGPDLVRVRLNGTTFHAERMWWGDGPDEYGWTVYRGGYVARNGERRGGRRIRSVRDARAVLMVVRAYSPSMPPPEWTYEAWCRRGGQPPTLGLWTQKRVTASSSPTSA